MTMVHDQSSSAAPPVRHAGLLTALVLAVAGYQVNATMLAPALPDVIERLDTTSGPAGLAQTLFFLFAAIGQVTITRLSDHLGRRRTLLVTLVVLITGEAICVFAPTIEIFIVGRMLQGVSAATFTLAYLILHESLPARRFGRPLGIAVASSVVTAATASGPATFGAFHAALWSSAGFVLLALLTALLIRTAPKTSTRRK